MNCELTGRLILTRTLSGQVSQDNNYTAYPLSHRFPLGACRHCAISEWMIIRVASNWTARP